MTEFEFCGPLAGPMAIMAGLPAVIYALYRLCPPTADHEHYANAEYQPAFRRLEACSIEQSLTRWAEELTESGCGWANPVQCLPSFDLDAFVVVIGWLAFQALLERVLPATITEGTRLRTSQTLKYRINGLLTFIITFVVLFYGNISVDEGFSRIRFGRYRLEWLHDHFLGIVTASVLVSFAFSVALYAASFRRGALLAEGGDTGYAVYDFFIGRELNPRVPGTTFDLKFFCELRPGLIGWIVLNVAFALKELELTGEIQPAMVMINLFQALYVVDALYFEPAVLSTMDITTDGFGFMLAFGDLSWVPFTYSLQARYLVTHRGLQSELALAFVFGLNVLGYYIFRMSNLEKDAFRRDPNAPGVRDLRYMDTKRGTRLLVSGWWGVARKINYTGDWLMGLAWCLVTGFDTFVTYFYATYFAVLLLHRAFRDDEMCHRKYGKDWDEYKKRVPTLFFPGPSALLLVGAIVTAYAAS